MDTFTDGNPAGGTTLDQNQRSIGLQLTFPIYSGGLVSSQVRQAVYQHRAAKERLERVARQTEHDARDSYLGVLSEISRVKALRRAVESNATSLRATESGYEAGTRTAVDVLQSRQLWVQAQTDYSRSRYDYMINVLKLQQAAGTLSRAEPGADSMACCTDVPPPAPPAPPDNQRFNEVEQSRDAAAIRFDDLPSDVPHALRARPDRPTAARSAAASSRASAHLQAPRRAPAATAQSPCRCGWKVRSAPAPQAPRAPADCGRRWAPRLPPTNATSAAGIERREFAHRVDQHTPELGDSRVAHPPLLPRREAATPRRASNSATASKRSGCRGTSSNSDVRAAACSSTCAVEHLLLFAGVRAAGDPHGP